MRGAEALSGGLAPGRAPAGAPRGALWASLGLGLAGIAVAQRAGSAQLLESVRSAFVAGMDQALWISAGFAVAGIVLGLAFLPRRAPAKTTPTPTGQGIVVSR